MSRRLPRGAPLAREIRLLVSPALGSWSKVLQLALLMLVFALTIAVLLAATAIFEPVPLIDSLLRGSGAGQ